MAVTPPAVAQPGGGNVGSDRRGAAGAVVAVVTTAVAAGAAVAFAFESGRAPPSSLAVMRLGAAAVRAGTRAPASTVGDAVVIFGAEEEASGSGRGNVLVTAALVVAATVGFMVAAASVPAAAC